VLWNPLTVLPEEKVELLIVHVHGTNGPSQLYDISQYLLVNERFINQNISNYPKFQINHNDPRKQLKLSGAGKASNSKQSIIY
jgi:hypothetical protein